MVLIHFSSLSSFIDDGCHEWFQAHDKKVALLGSLANDRAHIDAVLEGKVTCCKAFMWDSGAVSVRNNKTIITLEKYMGWVQAIKQTDIPLTVVALDVIGDPVASQSNYLRMKYDYSMGNNFLPVFHYGEPMEYLEFLMEEGFDYIGLGGVGAGDRLGQDNLRDWLKGIFFVNGDGRTLRYPNIKFHGFAITSKITLDMFPFYSVDSATWVKNSGVGKILTPYGDFRISNDSRAGYDNYHFKRVSESLQKKIRDWVYSLDLDFEKLADSRFEKHIVNLNYFCNIEQTYEWKPMPVIHTNMFSALGISGDEMKEMQKEEETPKLTLSFKPKEVVEEVEEELVVTEVEPVQVEQPIQVEEKPIQVEEHSFNLTHNPLFKLNFLCPHCEKPLSVRIIYEIDTLDS
jgi:hypothetical protein